MGNLDQFIPRITPNNNIISTNETSHMKLELNASSNNKSNFIFISRKNFFKLYTTNTFLLIYLHKKSRLSYFPYKD